MSSIFQKKRIHEEDMLLLSLKNPKIFTEKEGVPIQKTPKTIAKQFEKRPSSLILKLRMKLEHIYQVENAKPPFVTGDTDVEASQESSDNDNDNNKHYNIAAALQDKENKNNVPVVKKETPFMAPIAFEDYCRDVWNKDFWDIIESDSFSLKMTGLLRQKIIDACLCNTSQLPVQLEYFFGAGVNHHDFVQLNSCNYVKTFKPHIARHINKNYGKVCRFCLRNDPAKLLQFTQIRYSKMGLPSSLQPLPHVSYYACSGCYDKVIKIVAIFHHLWSVSMPLVGYGYQGYQCLDQLKFKFGSKNLEDIREAYDQFILAFKQLMQ